jgi:predicted 3-demethylubiquinone-9 3-methyltransferase (glyoxalase superfamily)
MRLFLCLSLAILTTSTVASAQEKLEGFAWLKQFEGTWAVDSKVPGAKKSDPGQKGTIHSKLIGNQWLINEHSAQLGPGTQFSAIQSLGFNSKAQKFKGTWIDSMMDHTWVYSGTLDEDGRILLESEGPDMADMSKMRAYRDVYEFTSPDEITAQSQLRNDDGEWETFIHSKITRMGATEQPVTPFLMFQGKGMDAIKLYQNVFASTEIVSMKKYEAGGAGPEGTIEVATISIEGQHVKCIDSPIKHEFDFTPSFSFFVECESEAQLKERFEKLSVDGKVMMPINNYGFSQQFGWVSDQYGISWQLNLK